MENQEYFRKIISFFKSCFFEDQRLKRIFDIILSYYKKYNKRPGYEVVQLEINNIQIDDTDFISEIKDHLKDIEKSDLEHKNSIDYYIDETEKYGKEKAIEFLCSKSDFSISFK
jgi:hypothetical protein